MGTNYPYLPLGEVTVNHDGVRVPVKEQDRKPGPYPYYGASGIVDHVDGYIFEGEYLLIAEDGENLRTRRTPVAFRATGKFWVNNHAHIVQGNDRALTRYLEYAVNSADISSYLTGSTMPKLTQGNMNRLPVIVPPLAVQKQIVDILGTLDDKIELNRKKSQILEQIARAIFKSWFIDFDPVRARREGKRPIGMDDATATLFPDNFEQSALGEIPKGWSICPLSTLAGVKHGYAFQGEYFSDKPTDMVLMTPGNFAIGGGFKADKSKFYSGPVEAEYILSEGDLVVTMTDLSKAGDTLGYAAFIGPLERGRRALHNQRVGKLIPLISQDDLHYLYQVCCSHSYRHHILGSATGSTVRHTSPSRILEHKVTLPPEQLRSAFAKMVDPLFQLQRSFMKETLILLETRDLLLPRLLSGDLTTREIA